MGQRPARARRQLVGTYHLDGEVSRRLLGALPPLLVVPADELDSPLVDLLAAEMARDEPGQDAVLDRLLDLLLIATLRAWFARPDGDAPAWYRANSDPVVGPALRLIYNTPGPPVDGRAAWRPRSACRGPRWPAASPSWSASRR